ncbi:MAG: TIM barrel protein [Cyclobacteriaceae bacterium]|nr:TIM barrel protein [Cyclobacteriaceae bacterium]
MKQFDRREFLKGVGLLSSYTLVSGILEPVTLLGQVPIPKKDLFFKISLAEWSLHKALQGKMLDHLDFPVKAKKEFDISAVEYVNQFFKDKATDFNYLKELKGRCDDHGVTSVLIMIDHEGYMADLDAAKRLQAVENHYKWADAAKFLGCHSIRVNCYGEGKQEEVAKAGIDGLHKLSEYAKTVGINVIVENHGGISSNGEWLSGVIKGVNLPNCGTLPDFGNFCVRREKKENGEVCVEQYDRYKGVQEMMPFAKGVSAKSYDFDSSGNCVETDYQKILSIVKSAGYKGHIGIEYEGSKLSEDEGIRATKKLLERVGSLLN